MEGLAHQQEEDERRRKFEEMHDVDRRDMIDQFASPNFVQQVEDSGITEDEKRVLVTIIQTVRRLCTFKPRPSTQYSKLEHNDCIGRGMQTYGRKPIRIVATLWSHPTGMPTKL